MEPPAACAAPHAPSCPGRDRGFTSSLLLGMATMPFASLGYSQWKRYCMLQLDSSQNSNLGPAVIVLLGKTQCIFPYKIKMQSYTGLPAMNMSLHAMLSISIFKLIKRIKLGSGSCFLLGFHESWISKPFFMSTADNCFTDFI